MKNSPPPAPFRTREARQEILIGATQQIGRLVAIAAHVDIGKQHDEIADHRLVERRAAIFLRQDALQRAFVGLFDRLHRGIDQPANIDFPFPARDRIFNLDVTSAGIGFQFRPARDFGDPERARGEIFLRILGIGIIFRFQFCLLNFERIGNIFQKDQTQRDMLVFGRLQIAAQLVRRLEELSFKSQISARCRHGANPPAGRIAYADMLAAAITSGRPNRRSGSARRPERPFASRARGRAGVRSSATKFRPAVRQTVSVGIYRRRGSRVDLSGAIEYITGYRHDRKPTGPAAQTACFRRRPKMACPLIENNRIGSKFRFETWSG